MLLNWAQNNWFVLLQSLGIVGGLAFTGTALRADASARRVQNLFALTRQHREIWSMLYDRPKLRRVLDPVVDLGKAPVTPDEELFIRFLIIHLSNSHLAMEVGTFSSPEGLKDDIASFFSLPIPRAVWEKARSLQDRGFVHYVEKAFQFAPNEAPSMQGSSA